jgi:serine/threonine-protein kinase
MAAADHDLLRGLLALQNGLIDRDQLAATLRSWGADRSRTLADHLVSLGHLSDAQRPALEAIATIHLEVHDGRTERSLAALATVASLGETLAAAGDPEIDQTLSLVGHVDDGKPDRAGVGAATSGGPRFRVVRPHARGGLGAVFVALDEELHREVALKQILDQHADDPTSRARFLLEAEVTGSLEHPGIVPVYGLGTDSDGRPYYAMRFIRGDSLKEAIDAFHADPALRTDPGRRSLAMRQLLRRFVDVCNAIEYAHARSVLHRDIKPANVIVGTHGETLVVDWGLAKAMGRAEVGAGPVEEALVPSSASGSAETLPGGVLGTPAYMSPEQAAGDLEHLGPRSDVYSLGATLAHLLTGRPPREGTLTEVLDAARRGESRSPRQVDPTIDRSLEAVCLKAMARDPEGRYPTARALAEDVERWMADEPVSAWREPFLRRARRWARRNRSAVTGAAAALIAGVVGLSAILVVQTRAKAEIARALGRETAANAALAAANDELARSKAAVLARYDLAVQAIKTFHTGVSEDFLLKEEKFQALRDRLLRSASDFYGKLGALLGRETDRASRRALAQANFELANLTAKVGRNADALTAHRAVLEARRAMAGEPGADDAARADVGRSLTEVAGLLEASGKTDDAMAAYREAESVLSGPASRSPEARAVLAACRSRMGFFLSTIGKNDEALAAYRLARSDQEAMAAAPGASREARRELGDTINRIGRLLQNVGRPKEAEAEYRAALAIRGALAEADPSDPEARNGVAASHNNLGIVLWRAGRMKEAEAEYRQATEVWRGLADDNPAVAEFRKQLQASHFNLANLMRQTGRSKEAEALFRSALAIQRALVEANPNVPDFRRRLALIHHYLGLALKETSRPSEAESEHRAALAIQRALAEAFPAVTDYRSDLGSTHDQLGILLAESGRSGEAEVEFRAELAIHRALAEANPSVTEFRDHLATAHVNLGDLLVETGRPSEAEPEYREAQAIFGGLTQANPAATYYRLGLGYACNRRGVLLAQLGRASEAEAEARRAAEIYRQLVEASPRVPDFGDGLAAAMTGLGDAVAVQGRTAEARDAYDRAIAIRQRLAEESPKSPVYRGGLAGSLRRRGTARRALGDPAGAAADLRRALAILDGLATRSNAEWFETACARAALADLAGAAGEADAAMALLSKAVAMGYRNPDAFRAEPALDGLRDRPDFRLLGMDLAFPDQPFAPGR